MGFVHILNCRTKFFGFEISFHLLFIFFLFIFFYVLFIFGGNFFGGFIIIIFYIILESLNIYWYKYIVLLVCSCQFQCNTNWESRRKCQKKLIKGPKRRRYLWDAKTWFLGLTVVRYGWKKKERNKDRKKETKKNERFVFLLLWFYYHFLMLLLVSVFFPCFYFCFSLISLSYWWRQRRRRDSRDREGYREGVGVDFSCPVLQLI